MKKLTIEIFINDYDVRFGCDDFVRGKISGYIDCIAKTFMRLDDGRIRRHSITKCDRGYIMTADVTQDEYDELFEIIGDRYSNLCRFRTINVVEVES